MALSRKKLPRMTFDNNYNTQQKEIYQNDMQQNDTQKNDIQQNVIRLNDIQENGTFIRMTLSRKRFRRITCSIIALHVY